MKKIFYIFLLLAVLLNTGSIAAATCDCEYFHSDDRILIERQNTHCGEAFEIPENWDFSGYGPLLFQVVSRPDHQFKAKVLALFDLNDDGQLWAVHLACAMGDSVDDSIERLERLGYQTMNLCYTNLTGSSGVNVVGYGRIISIPFLVKVAPCVTEKNFPISSFEDVMDYAEITETGAYLEKAINVEDWRDNYGCKPHKLFFEIISTDLEEYEIIPRIAIMQDDILKSVRLKGSVTVDRIDKCIDALRANGYVILEDDYYRFLGGDKIVARGEIASLPPLVPGDINRDGLVNLKDSQAILEIVAGVRRN